MNNQNLLVPISIIVAAIIGGGALIYWGRTVSDAIVPGRSAESAGATSEFSKVVLPIAWGDIGTRLVADGVIDMERLQAIYASRGGMPPFLAKILSENIDEPLRIGAAEAQDLLVALWAFGLANKSPVLSEGPISDPSYGGAERFASTGGWTLARGGVMGHFNIHGYVTLSPEQVALVARVSKNIYRPCCNNSTYFPDCNHGMAMLGLLELLAKAGIPEEEMYKYALAINEFWFPDAYNTAEKFLESRGISRAAATPQQLLGMEFSSASGQAAIMKQMTAPQGPQQGTSCGV